MVFLMESIVACALFTLMIKLISSKRQEVFTNDYPPVVTDKLRALGLIAEKPPAKKKDIIRKLTALIVFALLFALLMRYVNGIGKGGLPFMKKVSVYNQFYSDLITPLEEGICVPGTTVYCFYAAKMGAEYLTRYEKHFKNPVIHRFDMEHEELLVLYPEQWTAQVREVCL